MIFKRVKAIIFGLILGICFGMPAYLISTRLMEGEETRLNLTHHQHNNEAYWTAEDSYKSVKINDISSLIGTQPTITIHRKIHWPLVAASCLVGMILAYITYRRNIATLIPTNIPSTQP